MAERRAGVGGWTFDTLRVFVERIIDERFAHVQEQFKGVRSNIELAEKEAHRAQELARSNMDKWMTEHNQFMKRAETKDATFATREDSVRTEALAREVEKRLMERLEKLEQYKSNQEGRLWMLGALLTAIMVLLRYWPK